MNDNWLHPFYGSTRNLKYRPIGKRSPSPSPTRGRIINDPAYDITEHCGINDLSTDVLSLSAVTNIPHSVLDDLWDIDEMDKVRNFYGKKYSKPLSQSQSLRQFNWPLGKEYGPMTKYRSDRTRGYNMPLIDPDYDIIEECGANDLTSDILSYTALAHIPHHIFDDLKNYNELDKLRKFYAKKYLEHRNGSTSKSPGVDDDEWLMLTFMEPVPKNRLKLHNTPRNDPGYDITEYCGLNDLSSDALAFSAITDIPHRILDDLKNFNEMNKLRTFYKNKYFDQHHLDHVGSDSLKNDLLEYTNFMSRPLSELDDLKDSEELGKFTSHYAEKYNPKKRFHERKLHNFSSRILERLEDLIAASKNWERGDFESISLNDSDLENDFEVI